MTMAPTSQWSSWSNIQSLVLIVIALVVGSLAKSQTVDQLQLSNGLVSPDGIERQAILVNGELFRKPIVGTKGDEFVIEVDNQLTIPELRKSTSIHWHGLTQRGSAWADGASFITQCPIAPGNLFTYRFSVLDQAGTFWYHSHLSAQYCDGLRGAIVVHDPQDPQLNLYDVDDENTIITLADWYHSPASKLSGVVKPDSTLINGLGRTAATTDAPLAIISVQQGIRYRMRLIAMSCDPNWNFSIEGHELQVIEADAVNVEPITVKSLQIFAAQRYSFVLHANQPIDNYWVRANPNTGNPGFLGGINSAILRYAGAPEEEPRGLGSQLPTPELRETDLHPIESPRVPGRPEIDGADVNLIFNIGFNSGEFSINGHSFKPPTTPTLLQILSGTHQASDLLPQGSYYALPRNKVVQVSFPILNSNHSGGAVGAPHPFHLHGHTFSVVRSAGSLAYNFDNPVRRDVVSIGGAGDNVTIRFTTDNAGPWFLHCHIEWHFRSGLAVVLAEDVPGIIDGPEPPQEWQDLCTIYNDLDPKDQ